MPMTDDEMLFVAMCQVPVHEDISLKGIRERFMRRDRQWDEAEAEAEYRWYKARAILVRWRAATK